MSLLNSEDPGDSAGRRHDHIGLTLAVLLSIAPYISGLGFYSDDWAFIGAYATAPTQSVFGYFAASHSPHHAMRPVQLLLSAVLYRLFDLAPYGPHLFNAALVILNPLLCYWLLRELRAPRVPTLAVAFVYGLLPSYSTDRFWFIAFALTLSMTVCLASVLADLRAAAARTRAGYAWKGLGAVAAIVSVLAYEVTLGLLVLTPLLMILRSWQVFGRPDRRRVRYLATLIAIHLIVLSAIAVFKLQTTVRLGATPGGLPAQVISIARDAIRPVDPGYGLNVFAAARVHFGTYGVLLPRTTMRAARLAPAWLVWSSVGFAAAAFVFLCFVVRSSPWPSRQVWALTIVAGVIVFGAGYAIFLTNYNVQFTAAGIGNRSAIAAALGAAACMTAAAGLFASIFGTSARAMVFAALIATMGGSSFLIVNVIARFWQEAYGREQRVLAAIQRRFPTLPPHSTLLLDGVCPYAGPAVVFESNWDLKGALHTYYRDPTLKADVVTPRLSVTDAGIVTIIYGQRTTYPYDPGLLAYHAGTGEVRPLPDAASARAYFASVPSSGQCPAAVEGVGVPLF